MTLPPITVAFSQDDQLGECPLWDERREGLWWIDIKRHLVHFGQQNVPGGTQTWTAPGLVGCLALTTDHRVLVLGSDVWELDPTTGFTLVRHRPDHLFADNRFNDGRVDPSGRLWIGTMDDHEEQRTGSLYRFRRGVHSDPENLAEHVGIPNAMAFAPDGTRAYSADSWDDDLYMYPLDATTGRASERQVFAPVPKPGFADGACIDADGHLWLCLWAGSRIVRFSPDGEIEREIPLPVSQPTCPSFGGHDLTTLFVTTAAVGLTEGQLAAEPLAGTVLAIDMSGLGFSGRPEHRVDLGATRMASPGPGTP